MRKKYALSLFILLFSANQADALSLWAVNARCDCNQNTTTSICGTLATADGYGLAYPAGKMELTCTGVGQFGTYLDGILQSHQPVYNASSHCYGAGNLIFDQLNLTSVGTGFFVLAFNPVLKKWEYLGFALYRGYSVPMDLCQVEAPSCHDWTFSCRLPQSGGENPDIPPINGGGACAGQSVPAEECGGELQVIWDNKATCEYHCRGCDNAIAEWRNYCARGALSYYGAATDCNYYCDCAKVTAERNQTCPFGSNIDSNTCKYVCKPCVQLEIECENTCQTSTGALPAENQCQETVLGTPYEYKCTCSNGTPGGGGDGGGAGEECACCALLPLIKADTESIIAQTTAVYDDTQYLVEQSDLIKSDTESILSGQGDIVNVLGQIYDISQDHFVNNERILGEILNAIIDKEFFVETNINIDLTPVVSAVNDMSNALQDDLADLKADLHTALYEGSTPYQALMLAELRRIANGLLNAESGAQDGSLIDRMQGAIYLNDNNEWTFRTDIIVPEQNSTSLWDWLLAFLNGFSSSLNLLSSLLDAYFSGDTPNSPVYSDWDLTELGLHNDPSYQASHTLAQLDVAAAAASSASQYNSLPRPSISLLNPDPCVVSSSGGLSICFNTDVWQSLYLQLRLWGYFFAHLTSFVLVYRARTGISPSSSSDDE